jgi:hypothetical protein
MILLNRVILVARFPVLFAVISMSQKLANEQSLSVKMHGTDESVAVSPYVEDVFNSYGPRSRWGHMSRVSRGSVAY